MVKLDLHKTYMHMMPYSAIKCFTITYCAVLCTTVNYNGIKKATRNIYNDKYDAI